MPTNEQQEKQAPVPQRAAAPRPVRADAEDGPWSVSVADNNDGRSYTIYIKTPTHHLTLSRTTHEISDLHIKLSDAHPQTPLPRFPFDHPPKRKSTFLNTLSRLASSKPSTPISPNPESGSDPFAADTQPEPATGPTASTSLAAYLTGLSNHHVFRSTRQWKRFVRVRTDDLESVRVERTIKRARSDMAVHASGAAPSISDASTTASANPLTEEDEDGFLKEHTFLAAHLNGSRELLDLPVTAAAAVPLPEPTRDEIDPTSKPNGIEPEPVKTEPSQPGPSGVKEEEPAPVTAPVEDDIPAAARIPRSVSADPDKAARLSRLYQKAADPATPDVPSETEAEDSEHGGAMTDGGVVRRKKRKVRKAKLERQSKKVVVDDFEMMRVLGKGCAGKVLLVRHKASESLYALKAITKRHVLAHQELQHTLTEQAVLKRMAHESRDPFVVKLWWSFHDKDNLFLVMDFHPGGDLATQLARWGRLGRDRARFYAAEIVEGVEGLHAAGVIYRDLKPENILIGGDGHIVLTDFGLSKEFARKGLPKDKSSGGDDFYSSTPGTPTAVTAHWMDPSDPSWPLQTQNDTTTTFCGTAEYLAPEVIQGLPYSYPVDWWSFGTMLYEMLTGITPFWANNHSDMYVRVLQDELTFPEDKALDQDTKSLIRGLLQRNPALRISEPRIKRHPYFSMIDWSHVYHKRYIPPYIPPIDPSNASDTQNFDDAFLDMDPIIDNEPDADEQTESDRGGNTDSERTDGRESTTSSEVGESRSPSRHPVPDDDVFDGYSFKGRHSVLLDDEEEEDEGYDGVDEDEDAASSILSKDAQDTDSIDDQAPKTPVQKPPMLPPPEPVVEPVAEAHVDKEETPEPTTVKPDVREETPTPETIPKPTLITEHLKDASDATATDSAIAVTPTKAKTPTPAASTEESGSTVLVERPTVPASPPKPTSSKLAKNKTKTSPSATTAPPVTPFNKAQARARREKSGVPALDKKFKDATEDEGTATEREDDDWDFVETPGAEEVNGRQGTSLFARGVVDRYRLAFRKSSGQAIRVGSGTRTPSSTRVNEVSPSPTPSEKVRRNRGTTGLSLRKSTNKFLRAKSPPATFSASSRSTPVMTQSASATISASSAGLLTPSSSAPIGLSNASSLKSKVSTTSMSPGSSEGTSVNGDPSLRTVAIASAAADMPSPSKVNGNSQNLTSRRPPRSSSTDDHDRRSNSRNLKKMRNGAEKVLSLFSSPRQQ